MPNYVYKTFTKFAHPAPLRPHHAPHCWTQPAYGQKVQYATPIHTHDKLDLKGQSRVQAIVVTFLYFGRAVEPCVLVALNDIATYQAAPTTDTMKKTCMSMDYMYTYPSAKLR